MYKTHTGCVTGIKIWSNNTQLKYHKDNNSFSIIYDQNLGIYRDDFKSDRFGGVKNNHGILFSYDDIWCFDVNYNRHHMKFYPTTENNFIIR